MSLSWGLAVVFLWDSDGWIERGVKIANPLEKALRTLDVPGDASK
jgi:hypothetical protein